MRSSWTVVATTICAVGLAIRQAYRRSGARPALRQNVADKFIASRGAVETIYTAIWGRLARSGSGWAHMSQLKAAIVCFAVLYGVDAIVFNGWYFATTKQIVAHAYRLMAS
jgi:hypothetical protein